MSRIPIKPFPSYKWRWAEVTPSEGLNHPLRFLGVLRALYEHQGKPKSTTDINKSLEIIELETNELTGERVHLARTGTRNLFRNSGQYWKALGLLAPSHKTIELTPFGISVAEGKIAQHEFAVAVVKNMTLPNPYLSGNDADEWRLANLEIKPLQLILQVLNGLSKSSGIGHSYITPQELREIVVPLAGNAAPVQELVDALLAFRDGILDISKFPDCTQGSNDKRMLREFLLFLANYGFCYVVRGKNNETEQYFLAEGSEVELEAINYLPNHTNPLDLLKEIRASSPISDVERKKVWRKTTSRPEQQRFRSDVLEKFNYTCLLSGERISLVLEACHIIPVEHKGGDNFQNGLCLRSDLHTLFDCRHIRFSPQGQVLYSDTVKESATYRALPALVNFPNFLSMEALDWRFKYY